MIKFDLTHANTITHENYYPIGSVIQFNNHEYGMLCQIAPSVCKLITDEGNRYIDRELEIVHADNDVRCGSVRADDLRQIVNVEKVSL